MCVLLPSGENRNYISAQKERSRLRDRSHTSPLRCQSTPPQTDTVKMQETPVPAVPTTSHRPLTTCIPLTKSQDSSSNLSQMSAPLFTEDRYSSSSDDDLEVCDVKVTLINR